MGLWSRLRDWQRSAREREFTSHPYGYPSQHELEESNGYTPGGLDVRGKDTTDRVDTDPTWP